jgi:hypothetical protein
MCGNNVGNRLADKCGTLVGVDKRSERRAARAASTERVRVEDLNGQRVPLDAASLAAAQLRNGAAVLEARVVIAGRRAGVSWGRLGLLLGVQAETLRRRHSA